MELPLHWWVLKPGGFYRCSWCGIVSRVPKFVRDFKSIKPEDDNFDITCALVQDLPRDLAGFKVRQQLWECPVDGAKRLRINELVDEMERIRNGDE